MRGPHRVALREHRRFGLEAIEDEVVTRGGAEIDDLATILAVHHSRWPVTGCGKGAAANPRSPCNPTYQPMKQDLSGLQACATFVDEDNDGVCDTVQQRKRPCACTLPGHRIVARGGAAHLEPVERCIRCGGPLFWMVPILNTKNVYFRNVMFRMA